MTTLRQILIKYDQPGINQKGFIVVWGGAMNDQPLTEDD